MERIKTLETRDLNNSAQTGGCGLPGGPPLACVQTYGCQQNVADSQRLMGMLRDMGCAFTQGGRTP